MLQEILWFLPWCWFVNMSFDLLILAGRNFPWIKKHNTPIDGGIVFFDGYRLLGDSTTGFGLLQACTLGLLGALIMPGHYFFLLALLTWCGHAAGSFIKRRLGLARGAYLPGVDHIDYVLVAGTGMFILSRLSFMALLICIAITFIITPLITRIGYMLSIRTRPI